MPGFQTILVTTDFSETSRDAFPPALELAKRLGAKVVVVHVVEDRLPPFVDEFTAIPLDAILDSQTKRANKDLDAFLRTIDGLPADAERMVLHGTPHLEIVKAAESRSVDLIAIATHGRGFLTHALAGSTTERVVRRAPCPVLTVRSPSAA